MGHFAKVVDGKVTQVIVAEPEFFDTFTDTSPGTWLQTSYNTRGNVHYGPDGEPDGGVALVHLEQAVPAARVAVEQAVAIPRQLAEQMAIQTPAAVVAEQETIPQQVLVDLV